jgi:transcriptional regulator with XRE-family HTH domain
MQFGRQPGRQAIIDAGWTVVWVADRIGINRGHLRNALTGRCAPSDAVRDRLPTLLNRPLEELFAPELLAKQYTGPRRSAAVDR